MKFIDRIFTDGKLIRDSRGFITTPARIGRVGIQNYFDSTGKLIRVLRPEAEVFDPVSMASFENAPLVDNHPAGGEVNSKNVRELQRGVVTQLRREGVYLAATVTVQDAESVAKVEAGKRQLSGGYHAVVVDAEPGALWQGQPYDKIQTQIRANHVAIVAEGRAGPEVGLKLDGAEEALVSADLALDSAAHPLEVKPLKKDHPKMQIVLDGLTFEVADQTLAAAIEKAKNQAKTQIADAASSIEKLTAARDLAVAENTKLKADLAAATSPAAVAAAVASRVAIEKVASSHGVTCDGLDDLAVKRAVCAKAHPSLNLDGKSADYVTAVFDTVGLKPANEPKNKITAAIKPGVVNDESPKAKFNAMVFGSSAAPKSA